MIRSDVLGNESSENRNDRLLKKRRNSLYNNMLSAGASIAVARDSEKYGILMLRGKLINALNNKEEKLKNNEEIQLLSQALGLSIDNYDSSQLRYGRIGICVDSDSDGFHIGLLIMAAIQHYFPQFIEEDRLCWLRSPLYIVKQKGKPDKFFFTDQEKDEAEKNGKLIGEVQRNKGLGSLTEQQAKESMFNPENQRMDVLHPNKEAINLLQELMGSKIAPRKEFIFNNIDFEEVRE